MTEEGAREDKPEWVKKVIVGAEVFDLKGNMLLEESFAAPIPYKTSYWDLDLMEIVYWDRESNKIVIRKLQGDVIASFEP